MSATVKPTPAGSKVLRAYLDLEQSGHLQPVHDGRGAFLGLGMSLRIGDGSQLAAARKLNRDGLARLVGGFSNANRFVIITECGRAASASQPSPAAQSGQKDRQNEAAQRANQIDRNGPIEP